MVAPAACFQASCIDCGACCCPCCAQATLNERLLLQVVKPYAWALDLLISHERRLVGASELDTLRFASLLEAAGETHVQEAGDVLLAHAWRQCRLSNRTEALRRAERFFLRHNGNNNAVDSAKEANDSSGPSGSLLSKIRGSSAKAMEYMSTSQRGPFDFELAQVRGQISLLQAQMPLHKQQAAAMAAATTKSAGSSVPPNNMLGQPLCASM